MVSVGLVVHPGHPDAVALATEMAEWLAAGDHEVRIPSAEADARPELGRWAWRRPAIASGLDLAVSIGGDGTMLRAVDLVVAEGVPVLGVNLGRLGYLTEVEPARWQAALERFLRGAYLVEERMTLTVALERSGGDPPESRHRSALNDAVVEKLEAGHTVHLGLDVGGHRFLSCVADGVIIATPTGSTAYNLSAGGPVLTPTMDALVITPVAPHSLFDRSMVLGRGETVRLEVLGGHAALAVDGQRFGTLATGDALTCRAGNEAARLVVFEARDVRAVLKTKFGLTDR